MKNPCSISVSEINFIFMMEVGWRETVASSLFSEEQSRLPCSKKSMGLGKGSDLQYDLHSEEILKILENT